MMFDPANDIERCPVCKDVMPGKSMSKHLIKHFLLLQDFEAMVRANASLALLDLFVVLSTVFCTVGCIAASVRSLV
jgi:hypothetical protein